MTMKSYNRKLKLATARHTQKIGKTEKTSYKLHSKLYLLTYVKPRCFGYFI